MTLLTAIMIQSLLTFVLKFCVINIEVYNVSKKVL